MINTLDRQPTLDLQPLKLSPQQNKIYNNLKMAPLTTADFMNRECPHCGHGKGLNIVNFSQRITELNRLLAPHGEQIQSEQIKQGLWEYRLVKTT